MNAIKVMSVDIFRSLGADVTREVLLSKYFTYHLSDGVTSIRALIKYEDR